MTDLISSADSDVAGGFSSAMKLEKAYILIVPPSSPAGGALAATLGGDMASSAIGGGGSSGGGQGGSSGESALSSVQTSVGDSLGNKVEFLFNPLTYTITKAGNWDRAVDEAAMYTAIPTWRGAGPRVMTVEIFLDATYTASGNIQPDIDLLFKCCQPTPMSLLLQAPSPPFVLFGWGLTMSFLAFISNVSVDYKLFRPDGTPIRAACNLTLEEIPTLLASQNPTSGGAARRVRTTVAGDTLQSISYREYGRPTMWRALADANGIEDPLRIAPGTSLLVPPLGEATARS